MSISGGRFKKIFNTVWGKIPLQSRLFIALSLVFGVGFVFLSPPMKSPDEPQHYYRSFEVSELDVRATQYADGRYGYNLPDNVGTFGEQFLIREEKHLPPDINFIRSLNAQTYSRNRREIRFENSAVYSPVGYVSSALGIWISRVLNLSLLNGYYLGRSLNLLTYVLLVALALALAPAFRWILLSIALLPMSLFQAASFSPDAITNGFALLATGLFFYILSLRRVNYRHLGIILATLIPLALSKQVYVLFFLPFVFIPRNKFGSTSRRLIYLIAVGSVPLLFSLVWLALSIDVSSKLSLMFQLGNNVSASGQLKYLFGHPISYIYILLNTLLSQQSDYLIKGVLGYLGWTTVSLPLYTYLAITLSLAGSTLVEGNLAEKVFLSMKTKMVIGGTGILIALSICTSLYLSFTPVGSARVLGLQGRYFIPSLMLLLPFLVNRRFVLRVRQSDFAIVHTILICLILSSSLFSLVRATYLKSLL